MPDPLLVDRPWQEAREPGAVRDCATCASWQPGRIVLRGNTLGRCSSFATTTSADDTCQAHAEGGGPPR